ncbi:MAG: TIGR00730 family Rossman fold protein [Chryseolinea sp.]
MKRITVFCGSSLGSDVIFQKEAFRLGEYLAEYNIGLVYGGAQVGLMGSVANGVLSKGGEAIGVLPKFLGTKEVAHGNLSELILVDSMHERKTKMNELSDGVIALPGGFGTLEEFFEMLTWAQLGLHKKPIAILNMEGFYDPLLEFIQRMVDKGFLKVVNQKMLIVGDDIPKLIELMKAYVAPEGPKWITEGEV